MDEKDNVEGDRVYRTVIDALVQSCRAGQGRVGPDRVRRGIWNASATPSEMADQHEVNVLLARMSDKDRATIARLLGETFESGVHSALVALHEAQLPPFNRAYEGTPFHDFVGRLNDWDWPAVGFRS